MAVTGTGTQADPYIVTNYEDFISLSDHAAVADSSMYIQFNVPGSVIDCNAYGSEFKWGTFSARGDVTVYINLNGCTIKNLLIDNDTSMFYAVGYNDTMPRWHAAKIAVSNGSIRNVFIGSATSRLAYGEVTLQNVSISMNSTGSTVKSISGIDGHKAYMDNCALYFVQATLETGIMQHCDVTDTDFELHINNQNGQNIFPNSSFTDCRFQGKIGGHCVSAGINNESFVFDQCGLNGKALDFTNCVIDLDLTDSLGMDDSSYIKYGVFLEYNGYDINTNVICNSHYPSVGGERQYSYPTSWNYMPHEGNNGHNIRNADWLNSQGFLVIDVSGS